jgi:uncharacterized protein DUF6496
VPWKEVMGKFKAGKLHSGSKKGKLVKSKEQAVAIMLSEKRAAAGGKAEYAAPKGKPKKLTGRPR